MSKSESKQKRKLRFDSLFTRILVSMLLMFGLLICWVIYHFYFELKPNLLREEKIKSDMLMAACIPAFTQFIEEGDYTKAGLFSNRMLLLKNTQTDQPLLDGLVVKTLDSQMIINERSPDIRNSFVSETLLYSGDSDRRILGSLTLYYSPDYYNKMSHSIIMDLYIALGLVLVIICVSLILLNYLLRPFWHLARELEEFSLQQIEKLPPLTRPISIEIHRVKQAIDLLIESQMDHRRELEKKVKERTADLETALNALKESEEKYRNLVERSNDGIIIVQDHIIAYANPRFADIVRCDMGQLKGRAFDDFLEKTPKKKPVVGESKESKPTVSETVFLDANRKKIYVELNTGPIQYQNRTADLVVVRDISGRKQMEMELGKRRNLESLGVLAGGIAHDFNNLLTAVFGNIELSRLYGLDTKEASRLLSEASLASERARNLTQQLLTFSKGGNPIKEVASISEIVRETCSLVLSGTPIQIMIHIPDDIWAVEVDRGQISQVIHNLLLNAKNAMPEGGELNIRAENHRITKNESHPLQPGNFILLSVQDNGSGIRTEDLPRIFDPYFTTRNDGTNRGSGLGLAICHSIVKRHEGDIQVVSESGEGTVFHVYLPASGKTVKTRERQDHDQDVPEQRENIPKKRVLFMDDEKSVYKVAESMLTFFGFEVSYAEHGEKAIQMYQEEFLNGRPFDVVILDLTVRGGMGGKQACVKLKEIDPSVCTIVASGYAEDPVIARYPDYGFKAAVTKPFGMKTLKDAIEIAAEKTHEKKPGAHE